MTHSLLKKISLIVALLFALNDLSPGAFAAGISVSYPLSSESAPSEDFLAARVSVPEKLGTVDEILPGKENQLTLIYLTDAHAVPAAQKSLFHLIEFFRNHYGIDTVALEGTKGVYDPPLFRAFPDAEKLKKVFESYLETGELSAAVAASVLSARPIHFEGVEDWKLYEAGVAAFLEALSQKPELDLRLHRYETRLQRLKTQFYSPKALELDSRLKAWGKSQEDLTGFLKFLAQIREPAAERYPSLSAMREALRQEDFKDQEALDREILAWAGQVRPHLKTKEEISAFSGKLQGFKTQRVSRGEFALFLSSSFPRMTSPQIRELIASQTRLQKMQGTVFFQELQGYIREIKAEIFPSAKEKRLDRLDRKAELIRKLAALELSSEEWKEAKLLSSASAARRFYEISEERDRGFLKNLHALAARKKTRTLLFVGGGFHAAGLKEKLQKEGSGLVVVHPKIESLPAEIHYQDYMQGRVSWREYFKIKNGRINLREAFSRAAADRLFQETGDTSLLKSWRDRLLQNLFSERRIAASGRYTRFIDEKLAEGISAKQVSSFKSKWTRNLEEFLQGLQLLDQKSQINEASIAGLLARPTSLHPYAIPNHSIPADWLSLRASQPVLRSEVRAAEAGQEFLELALELEKEHTVLVKILQDQLDRIAWSHEKNYDQTALKLDTAAKQFFFKQLPWLIGGGFILTFLAAAAGVYWGNFLSAAIVYGAGLLIIGTHFWISLKHKLGEIKKPKVFVPTVRFETDLEASSRRIDLLTQKAQKALFDYEEKRSGKTLPDRSDTAALEMIFRMLEQFSDGEDRENLKTRKKTLFEKWTKLKRDGSKYSFKMSPLLLANILILVQSPEKIKNQLQKLGKNLEDMETDLEEALARSEVRADEKVQAEQIMEWIQQLGDEREGYRAGEKLTKAGPEAVPYLIKALVHQNQSIRKQAIEILGRRKDKEAIPALSGILKNGKDDAFRNYAAGALYQFDSAEADQVLLETFFDPETPAGKTAKLIFETAGGHGGLKPLLEEVQKNFKLYDSYKFISRFATALAFAAVQQNVTTAIPWLSELMNHSFEGVRAAALRGLGKLENEGRSQAMELLWKLVLDNKADGSARSTAASALRQLKATRPVSDLIPLLARNNDEIKELAQEALVAAGAEAVPSLIVRLTALEKNDYWERVVILKILGEIKDEKAINDLIEMLKHDSVEIRSEAAKALQKFGENPILEQKLGAGYQDVLKGYSYIKEEAYGKLVELGAAAIPALTAIVLSEDSGERVAKAVQVLGRIPGQQSIDLLLKKIGTLLAVLEKNGLYSMNDLLLELVNALVKRQVQEAKAHFVKIAKGVIAKNSGFEEGIRKAVQKTMDGLTGLSGKKAAPELFDILSQSQTQVKTVQQYIQNLYGPAHSVYVALGLLEKNADPNVRAGAEKLLLQWDLSQLDENFKPREDIPQELYPSEKFLKNVIQTAVKIRDLDPEEWKIEYDKLGSGTKAFRAYLSLLVRDVFFKFQEKEKLFDALLKMIPEYKAEISRIYGFLPRFLEWPSDSREFMHFAQAAQEALPLYLKTPAVQDPLLNRLLGDAFAQVGPFVGSNIEGLLVLAARPEAGIMTEQEKNRILMSQLAWNVNANADLPQGHMGGVYYRVMGYRANNARDQQWPVQIKWLNEYDANGNFRRNSYTHAAPEDAKGFRRAVLEDAQQKSSVILGYLGHLTPREPGLYIAGEITGEAHFKAEGYQVYEIGKVRYQRPVKRVRRADGTFFHVAPLGLNPNLSLAFYEIVETGVIFTACVNASILRADAERERKNAKHLDSLNLEEASAQIVGFLAGLRKDLKNPAAQIPGFNPAVDSGEAGQSILNDDSLPRLTKAADFLYSKDRKLLQKYISKEKEWNEIPDFEKAQLLSGVWMELLKENRPLAEAIEKQFRAGFFLYELPASMESFTRDGLMKVALHINQKAAEKLGAPVFSDLQKLENQSGSELAGILTSLYQGYLREAALLHDLARVFSYDETTWAMAAVESVSVGIGKSPSTAHYPVFRALEGMSRPKEKPAGVQKSPYVRVRLSEELSQNFGLKGRTYFLSEGGTVQAALETIGINSFENIQIRLFDESAALDKELKEKDVLEVTARSELRTTRQPATTEEIAEFAKAPGEWFDREKLKVDNKAAEKDAVAAKRAMAVKLQAHFLANTVGVHDERLAKLHDPEHGALRGGLADKRGITNGEIQKATKIHYLSTLAFWRKGKWDTPKGVHLLPRIGGKKASQLALLVLGLNENEDPVKAIGTLMGIADLTPEEFLAIFPVTRPTRGEGKAPRQASSRLSKLLESKYLLFDRENPAPETAKEAREFFVRNAFKAVHKAGRENYIQEIAEATGAAENTVRGWEKEKEIGTYTSIQLEYALKLAHYVSGLSGSPSSYRSLAKLMGDKALTKSQIKKIFAGAGRAINGPEASVETPETWFKRRGKTLQWDELTVETAKELRQLFLSNANRLRLRFEITTEEIQQATGGTAAGTIYYWWNGKPDEAYTSIGKDKALGLGQFFSFADDDYMGAAQLLGDPDLPNEIIDDIFDLARRHIRNGEKGSSASPRKISSIAWPAKYQNSTAQFEPLAEALRKAELENGDKKDAQGRFLENVFFKLHEQRRTINEIAGLTKMHPWTVQYWAAGGQQQKSGWKKATLPWKNAVKLARLVNPKKEDGLTKRQAVAEMLGDRNLDRKILKAIFPSMKMKIQPKHRPAGGGTKKVRVRSPQGTNQGPEVLTWPAKYRDGSAAFEALPKKLQKTKLENGDKKDAQGRFFKNVFLKLHELGLSLEDIAAGVDRHRWTVKWWAEGGQNRGGQWNAATIPWTRAVKLARLANPEKEKDLTDDQAVAEMLGEPELSHEILAAIFPTGRSEVRQREEKILKELEEMDLEAKLAWPADYPDQILVEIRPKQANGTIDYFALQRIFKSPFGGNLLEKIQTAEAARAVFPDEGLAAFLHFLHLRSEVRYSAKEIRDWQQGVDKEIEQWRYRLESLHSKASFLYWIGVVSALIGAGVGIFIAVKEIFSEPALQQVPYLGWGGAAAFLIVTAMIGLKWFAKREAVNIGEKLETAARKREKVREAIFELWKDGEEIPVSEGLLQTLQPFVPGYTASKKGVSVNIQGLRQGNVSEEEKDAYLEETAEFLETLILQTAEALEKLNRPAAGVRSVLDPLTDSVHFGDLVDYFLKEYQEMKTRSEMRGGKARNLLQKENIIFDSTVPEDQKEVLVKALNSIVKVRAIKKEDQWAEQDLWARGGFKPEISLYVKPVKSLFNSGFFKSAPSVSIAEDGRSPVMALDFSKPITAELLAEVLLPIKRNQMYGYRASAAEISHAQSFVGNYRYASEAEIEAFLREIENPKHPDNEGQKAYYDAVVSSLEKMNPQAFFQKRSGAWVVEKLREVRRNSILGKAQDGEGLVIEESGGRYLLRRRRQFENYKPLLGLIPLREKDQPWMQVVGNLFQNLANVLPSQPVTVEEAALSFPQIDAANEKFYLRPFLKADAPLLIQNREEAFLADLVMNFILMRFDSFSNNWTFRKGIPAGFDFDRAVLMMPIFEPTWQEARQVAENYEKEDPFLSGFFMGQFLDNRILKTVYNVTLNPRYLGQARHNRFNQVKAQTNGDEREAQRVVLSEVLAMVKQDKLAKAVLAAEGITPAVSEKLRKKISEFQAMPRERIEQYLTQALELAGFKGDDLAQRRALGASLLEKRLARLPALLNQFLLDITGDDYGLVRSEKRAAEQEKFLKRLEKFSGQEKAKNFLNFFVRFFDLTVTDLEYGIGETPSSVRLLLKGQKEPDDTLKSWIAGYFIKTVMERWPDLDRNKDVEPLILEALGYNKGKGGRLTVRKPLENHEEEIRGKRVSEVIEILLKAEEVQAMKKPIKAASIKTFLTINKEERDSYRILLDKAGKKSKWDDAEYTPEKKRSEVRKAPEMAKPVKVILVQTAARIRKIEKTELNQVSREMAQRIQNKGILGFGRDLRTAFEDFLKNEAAVKTAIAAAIHETQSYTAVEEFLQSSGLDREAAGVFADQAFENSLARLGQAIEHHEVSRLAPVIFYSKELKTRLVRLIEKVAGSVESDSELDAKNFRFHLVFENKDQMQDLIRALPAQFRHYVRHYEADRKDEMQKIETRVFSSPVFSQAYGVFFPKDDWTAGTKILSRRRLVKSDIPEAYASALLPDLILYYGKTLTPDITAVSLKRAVPDFGAGLEFSAESGIRILAAALKLMAESAQRFAASA